MLILVMLILIAIGLFGCGIQQSAITTRASTYSPITPIIKEVKWNLSGTVMPQPEYGSGDILNSDKESVLTIDQTDTQVQITGDMSGLNKNTTYSVLLANGYAPNTVYPGLFTNKVPAFTFLNDPTGVNHWTFILLNADFPGPGTYTLSVWINESGTNTTVLISDNFAVTIH